MARRSVSIVLISPLALLAACGSEIDTEATEDETALAAESVTCPPGGSLRVGQTYVVAIDRFTGDEGTTEPKTDSGDGRGGDNPHFRRHNVARAHLDYWYTSSHQGPGEPDPRGQQYVDYRPPLQQLGAGRYQIRTYYRQTANRASYPAQYIVRHLGGRATSERDQRRGTGYVAVDLGTFDLGCTGFVRVRDTGGGSITFNKMEFKYLGR